MGLSLLTLDGREFAEALEREMTEKDNLSMLKRLREEAQSEVPLCPTCGPEKALNPVNSWTIYRRKRNYSSLRNLSSRHFMGVFSMGQHQVCVESHSR